MPVTLALGDGEVEGPEVEGHRYLHSKLEGSLNSTC